jgi:hypothetical protein
MTANHEGSEDASRAWLPWSREPVERCRYRPGCSRGGRSSGALRRTVRDRDVSQLRWLSSRLGDDLPDAVVLTAGTEAYRRKDGIATVPLALLGPWCRLTRTVA